MTRRQATILIAPLSAWLLGAFAAPLATVLLLAVQADSNIFAPITLTPSLAQFRVLTDDLYYIRTLANTLGLAFAVTLGAIVFGFPIALWLSRLPQHWRPLAVGLILIPLLTNVVVRSLGIILLLSPTGIVNGLAKAMGFSGVNLLFTWFSVWLALVQVFMPFMVMSLYDNLQSLDPQLASAGRSLGAGRMRQFWLITFPLALPGLAAGSAVVFLLSSSAYVSATLLGGKKVWVSGMQVFQEALNLLNQPLASALATVMLLVAVAASFAINRALRRAMPWTSFARPWSWPIRLPVALGARAVALLEAVGPTIARALLAIGLFLVLFPIALVMVNSFNDVPQASVGAFRGFTWKWYSMVLFGGAYLPSFLISAELALVTTAITLVLTLPAAFALQRARLPGHEAIGAAMMLPLALPGIALAVGMLRLLQWFTAIPAFWGLVMMHVVLTAPFTLALLRASVAQLDRALEDAAASLGASNARTFWHVVLPILTPGVIVAGVIAFLISFGEVTVTAFLTTARMTTLPVRIYAEAQFSMEPTVNAVSTLTVVATIGALVLINRFVGLDRVWRR